MIEGRCHCGRLSWTLADPPASATACNCTVCRRYGALWAYGVEGDGIETRGESQHYRPAEDLEFHTCPVCGGLSHWRLRTPNAQGRHQTAVNLRLALDPAQVRDLPVRHFDGLESFTSLGEDERRVGHMWA